MLKLIHTASLSDRYLAQHRYHKMQYDATSVQPERAAAAGLTALLESTKVGQKAGNVCINIRKTQTDFRLHMDSESLDGPLSDLTSSTFFDQEHFLTSMSVKPAAETEITVGSLSSCSNSNSVTS